MPYASVNQVYQLVKRGAAKQEQGFISPEDFNAYAGAEQQGLFQSILSEYRLYQANRQRYLNYYNGSYNSLQAIQDDLQPLKRDNTTLATNSEGYAYPDNYAYYIDLYTGGATSKQRVDVVEYGALVQHQYSYDGAPSQAFPIAALSSDTIYTLPYPITSTLKISYYKTPQGVDSGGNPVVNTPAWAYVEVNGKAVHDPNNSIDFELPKHLEYRLASRILLRVGIEIREPELFQMVQATKAEDKQDAQV